MVGFTAGGSRNQGARDHRSRPVRHYTQFLKPGSLIGARIGIGRDFVGPDPETIRVFDDRQRRGLSRRWSRVVDAMPEGDDWIHEVKLTAIARCS